MTKNQWTRVTVLNSWQYYLKLRGKCTVRMNKKRINSIVLCIMCCISLAACGGQQGNQQAANGQPGESGFVMSQQQGKADISIPEEITFEFFGMNLIGANRPMREKHVFDLNDLGEKDYINNEFFIGHYKVMHSYYNFENSKNFSSYVNSSQILFDKNNKLTKIDINANLGEAFSTSFLNIEDNVKDYFDSFEAGLWDRFRNGEEIVADHGYILRYTTISGADVEYDNLQVYNRRWIF